MSKVRLIKKGSLEEFRYRWEGANAREGTSISSVVMDEMIQNIKEIVAQERSLWEIELAQPYGHIAKKVNGFELIIERERKEERQITLKEVISDLEKRNDAGNYRLGMVYDAIRFFKDKLSA